MNRLSLLLFFALVAQTAACGSDEPGGTTGSSGGGSGGGSSITGGNGGSSGAGSAGLAGAGGSSAGSSGGAGLGGGGGSSGRADCATAPSSLFCMPLGDMPASIKATGLFPAAPNLSVHPANMLEYVPDPPLWSDGLEKQRFLVLPPGQKIDNTSRERWVFPEGTFFIKTFFDDSGPGGARQPIETRLIRLTKTKSYEFFVYRWNQDGSDATLIVKDIDGDINMSTSVMVKVERMIDGKPLVINGGQPFEHTLPSRNQCGECHEKNGMQAQTFIGFDELRLNSKLTAQAPKTQLQAFADAGIFTTPIPADPASITDDSNDGGRLLRIKRFIFGNCVTCHNGDSVFDMHPDVFVANTVGKPTESQSVMPPPGWLRVVPGSPSTSVLYVQMQRTMLPQEMAGKRLRPMPPIGLADVAVEQGSLKDVFDWISALPH